MMRNSTHPTVKIKSEKDRIIWDNLVYLAEKHGWETDAEAARAIGMWPQQLGAIKKGERGIGNKSVKRICDKTGVSEEWLLRINNEEGGEMGESMEDQIEYWKEKYEDMKWQHKELKFLYEELKANPRKAGESIKKGS